MAAKLEALPQVTPKNRAKVQAACREASDVDQAAGFEVALGSEVAINAEVLLDNPDDFDHTVRTFGSVLRAASYAANQAAQQIRIANHEDNSAEIYELAGVREVYIACARLIRSMCELESSR